MCIYYEMGAYVVTRALLSRAQTKWQVCNPSAVAIKRLLMPILTHPRALHDDLLVHLVKQLVSIPANQEATYTR